MDGYGDFVASTIGSRASENVDVDELGEYGKGGTEVVGERTSRDNVSSWPSRTDCFRACGWFGGRASVRASGEGM